MANRTIGRFKLPAGTRSSANSNLPKNLNGNSNAGIGTLLGFMLSQQKAQQAQQAATTQDPFDRFGIPPEARTDYNLKPRFDSVNGTPISVNVPELKPEIPEADSTLITSGRNNAAGIKRSIQDVIGSKNIQGRMSPFNLSAHSGFIGDLASKIEAMTNSKDAAEFNEFKSRTNRMFQNYRKFVTGSQAGFPEIQFLTPNFPQASDPPSKFVSTALSALEDMKQNDQMIVDVLDQRGMRTRSLKDGFNIAPDDLRSQAIQAGINVNPTNPIPGAPGGFPAKKSATARRYQLGQILAANGKHYEVVGVDDPNDPDLKEVA